MGWVRNRVLGRGSFGVVYLVKCSKKLYAVKTSTIESSVSLQKEHRILKEFVGCKEVVRCYGCKKSVESGHIMFNLVLEYAPGGSLSHLITAYGGKIPEIHVRIYTRMLLKGLSCIHKKGYVHCDLKPTNILVFPSRDGLSHLKIADFGLSKEPAEKECPSLSTYSFRGTPLYMSPESVVLGKIEAPLDIWSLGCVVLEMVTGKPLWKLDNLTFELELPRSSENLSEMGRDFLSKCFAVNSAERWTADMLLNHPFALMQEESKSLSLDDYTLSTMCPPSLSAPNGSSINVSVS